VHRSNITRSKIHPSSVSWSEILKQLNLVTVTFKHSDRNLSTRHSGDFTGEITGMMCPMRKLEAKNILPECDRAVEITHRYTGVIRGDYMKWRSFRDSEDSRFVNLVMPRVIARLPRLAPADRTDSPEPAGNARQRLPATASLLPPRAAN